MLPLKAKKDITDVIKLNVLGEDDPGLSRWVLNAIASILKRRRHNILGRFNTKKEGNVTTEARCYTIGFEDGSGHKSKNVRNAALETGKSKETDSPLGFLEGAWPC